MIKSSRLKVVCFGLPSKNALGLFFFHRVRPASPAKVSRPSELQSDRERHFECQNSDSMDCLAVETKDYKRNLSISVLLSKPILALQFNCLKMQVESPVVVSQNSQNS